MIKVRRAFADDFTDIHAHLLVQLNPHLSRNIWMRMFIDHFDLTNYFGWVLEDNQKIVGFLGAIFSQRTINNEKIKFCNMTSWIVLPEYRDKSILLLFNIHRLKDHVLTNFSASKDVQLILEQSGWQKYPSELYRILPSFKGILNKQYVVLTSKPKIEPLLGRDEKKIFYDHKKFKCIHLYIRCRVTGVYAYTILRRINYSPFASSHIPGMKFFKIPFSQVYYSSNYKLFYKSLDNVLAKLCMQKLLAGILVFEHNKNKYQYSSGVPHKHSQAIYSKSNHFAQNDLDLLYSELIIFR